MHIVRRYSPHDNDPKRQDETDIEQTEAGKQLKRGSWPRLRQDKGTGKGGKGLRYEARTREPADERRVARLTEQGKRQRPASDRVDAVPGTVEDERQGCTREPRR